jgi:hypothetical protein
MFTHSSLPSAGPPFSTSLTAMDGSPFAKCGLSRPPDTKRHMHKILDSLYEENDTYERLHAR